MGAITAVIGAVGSWIGAIIAGAVTLTLVFVLWKSGAIPPLIDLGTAFLGLAGSAITGFFTYLTELVKAF